MTTNEQAIKEFMAQKPIEKRLYLILYYDAVAESDTFITSYGRWDAYQAIRGICERGECDPKDITVLVEYVVRDRNNPDNLVWAMMHPDNPNAKNGYQFCKAIEPSIKEEERFIVEDYTEDREGEQEEFSPGPNPAVKPASQLAQVTGADIAALNELGNLEGGEVVTTDDYLAMIQNRNTDLFTAPDEDAFEGIAPDGNPFV